MPTNLSSSTALMVVFDTEAMLNRARTNTQPQMKPKNLPQSAVVVAGASLPLLLTKLYSDCQTFAETEINSLLEKFEQISPRT